MAKQIPASEELCRRKHRQSECFEALGGEQEPMDRASCSKLLGARTNDGTVTSPPAYSQRQSRHNETRKY